MVENGRMKKQHVQLTQTDRNHLETLVRKGILKARSYRRALGLLELDRRKTYTAVTETLGVSLPTLSLWAAQYREKGLKMLDDRPRPGRPIKIGGEQRAKITALATANHQKAIHAGICGFWRKRQSNWATVMRYLTRR